MPTPDPTLFQRIADESFEPLRVVVVKDETVYEPARPAWQALADIGQPNLGMPAVLVAFRDYHQEHCTWGALHIVLDDGNTEDSSVDLCIGWAERAGDAEGVALARCLRRMSVAQRDRMGEVLYG